MPGSRRFFLRRYRIYRPYFLRHGMLLLFCLLVGDGVAFLSFPKIQAALSLNAARVTPVVVSGRGMGIAAPLVDPGATVLASDTFRRPDRLYWGTASDGQVWQGDAGQESNFRIAAHAGVIEPTTPPGVSCDALLGASYTNSEVLLTAVFSRYDGSSQLGAVLRWRDAGNYYGLILDGQTLMLERVMDGVHTPLQSLRFPIQATVSYTFRFRVQGTSLFALVWPTAQPAPTDWQIAVTDTALSRGRAGLHALIQREARAEITSFKEIKL